MRRKTKFQILFVAGLLSVFSCGNRDDAHSINNVVSKEEAHENYTKYFVPVSGNSFITTKPKNATEIITDKQLENWTNPNTVISTYFRVSKKEKLNIGIKASVPNEEKSSIKITINGIEKKISIEGTEFKEYDAGEFQIPTAGYVKVDIQGVKKTGDYFANVTDIIFSGEAATGKNVFAQEPAFYDYVKKGPSSDIFFTLPKEEVTYFYNESTILENNKYMGFVPFNFNSSILEITTQNDYKVIYFEVLNDSDKDPKKIPKDLRTTVNKKGDGVEVFEFFGADSVRNRGILKYNWEVGKTYNFLVKVKPDGDDNIDYTAWFKSKDESSWKLIVSFKKKKWKIDPQKKLYSFLENNDSEHGYLNRKVTYNNPWVITKSEKWIPLTEANFSTYSPDIYKQRTDAIAKTTKNGLILQNGGFFNETMDTNAKLTIAKSEKHPDINFSDLP